MRLAAILVAALATASCAHGGGSAPVRPPSASELVTAARGTVEQWRQAYQVKGMDALATLYANDPELVVVQDGTPIVGWKLVETTIKSRLEHTPKIVIRLRDMTVVPLGDNAATVTAVMTRELGDDVTTVTDTGALTMVLRRERDRWVIVAEHYSYRKGT
jgi:ketosteroid isomerase-like protein